MSIKAMTWAFGLPLEPRAKIALLAIADNSNDEGVAWPSKDTIAEKSSQSRATVQRRLKSLEAIGVLACFARYREDGTQTSDEIRLNLAVTADTVMRKMHDAGEANERETEEDGGVPASEDAGRNTDDATASQRGGGCQADTLGSHSCDPTVAVVTGGGLQSCNPLNEPSLEPKNLPPNPPPGGRDQKSDQGEGEASGAPDKPEHFEVFFTSCQHWRTMDRSKALTAFRFLTADEQAMARAASLLHAEECTKAKRRSKDAHKLIVERFWERYPNARLADKPPEPVWIDEGPDVDGLRVLSIIADSKPPALIHDEVKGSGLLRRAPVGEDLRALAQFIGGDVLDWFVAEPDTREFNAWRHRLHEWTGRWIEPRIVIRRGARMIQLRPGSPPEEVKNRLKGIPVPCRWPPKKDGTIYRDDQSSTGDNSEGHAA